MNRRSLLQTLGASLLASIARVPMPQIPLDDTAYLQGLIDRAIGSPIINIPKGVYRLARTLIVGPRTYPLHMRGEEVELHSPPDGSPAIYIES